MTNTQKISIGLSVGFIALAVLLMYTTSQKALGSAPIGLATSFSTTTPVLVGPNWAQIFYNSSVPNCSSRVITTSLYPIRLAFGTTASSTATSTINISSSIGILQPASTTVAYDGGIYGCGFIGVQGLDVGTSTVTLTTFN